MMKREWVELIDAGACFVAGAVQEGYFVRCE